MNNYYQDHEKQIQKLHYQKRNQVALNSIFSGAKEFTLLEFEKEISRLDMQKVYDVYYEVLREMKEKGKELTEEVDKEAFQLARQKVFQWQIDERFEVWYKYFFKKYIEKENQFLNDYFALRKEVAIKNEK
jgi:hypothetical protein